MLIQNRKISEERTSELLKQEPMMKPYNEKIEAEIAKTMKLLDELEPLKVHHLFRVRVMESVEKTFSRTSGRVAKAHDRMADLRFAFMALLFIVNVGSALLSIQNGQRPLTTQISEFSDATGDDYSAQEFAYYDQTLSDPAATGGNGSLAPGK